jgi:hypothetical protein
MTFQETVDDARVKIGAYVTFEAITTSDQMLCVSEGLSEMQKRTGAIEKTLTILATDLDANGMIALDKSVTVPRRGTYTPLGGCIASPCDLKFIGRDIMAEKKLNSQWSQTTPRRILATVEQSKLVFYPFQGLTGTFSISCVAKMPPYVPSAASDTTSYWYGWTPGTALDTKFKTIHIPQEFDDAYSALVAYTAAALIALIPGWQRKFPEKYGEMMAKFDAAMQNVRENLPDYDLNYEPKADYGW